MKSILSLFIIIISVVSCSTEDMGTLSQKNGVDTKKIVSETQPIFDLNEHADLLDWNSYIIGEMMRDDAIFRNQVLSQVDPYTHTVEMESIIDLHTENSLSYVYQYYADYSMFYYTLCKPDVTMPFPPRIRPKLGDHTVSQTSVGLMNLMNQHPTELYIPNLNFTGDIFTTGHPLTDVYSDDGYRIHTFIEVDPDRHCDTIEFTIDAIIDIPLVQQQNAFVIVSRPTISSLSNYNYINVDINKFLMAYPTRSGNSSLY